MSMRRFDGGWIGRVRIGTSATMLMYALPPILKKLKTAHPELEINLKAGLTSGTLELLRSNSLDLGLCALPIHDPAFETVQLFKDELVAILPAGLDRPPKRVTPEFLSRCALILGNSESALRKDVTEWLSRAGAPPKPVMVFDNVEAIKSLVAVGMGASIVPRLCLNGGHIGTANMAVVPLSPQTGRRVALVKLRGKKLTIAQRIVWEAL